jgi:hypothetical protein
MIRDGKAHGELTQQKSSGKFSASLVTYLQSVFDSVLTKVVLFVC